MALEKKTSVAQINLNFDADGKLVDCTVCERVQFIEDGEIVSETTRRAPIDEKQLTALLGDALGPVTAKMLSLEQERDSLQYAATRAADSFGASE